MKYFVTGIGTDVGKSWATGWLARRWMNEGKSVITQKFIQTGNIGSSEDICIHRHLMGISMTIEDRDMLTAPEIFSYPCSPDLASRIDGREINFNKIEEATKELESRYEIVLIEGAGGVMVPLKGEYLTIDYIKDHDIATILVINGQLGSISHTLLALYTLLKYEVTISEVVYNPYFDKDQTICEDTKTYVKNYLKRHSPSTKFTEMGLI